MSFNSHPESAALARKPMHRRNIDVQGYQREDGLWEIEAILRDTKHYEITLRDRGLLSVGDHLHDITMTLVVDDRMVIREVRADMQATPYRDCPGAEPNYGVLPGMKIRAGWINEVKDKLGRTASCTHLTELLPVLATAAFQTIQGYRLEHTPGYASSERNRLHMQNTCFGYREGGRAEQILWKSSDNPDDSD